MQVKGSLLLSVQAYINDQFPNRYSEWLGKLPDASKKLYEGSIQAAEWYDYQSGLIAPSELVAELFFHKDEKKAAWELGRFSAETGLRGIYKVFVFIAKPKFIIKRASKIMASFYKPSVLKTETPRKHGVDVTVTDFPEPTEISENRIAGWMERALEICGAKNVKIDVLESPLKGGEKTVYEINWEKSSAN